MEHSLPLSKSENSNAILSQTSAVKDVNTKSSQAKDSATLLLDAYHSLYANDIACAIKSVKEARILNVENEELRGFDIALQQWNSYILEMKLLSDSEEKGNFLLDTWKKFKRQHKTISSDVKISQIHSRGLDALQNFVINITQVCYKHALKNNPEKKQFVSFKMKVFQCLKMLGEYEKAFHIIMSLSSRYARDSYLLSQLADCNELMGRTQNAKLFFREAFFWNPQKILLDELETVSIHSLFSTIKNQGCYESQYFVEWVPVYGYIEREFSVTRQLHPIEIHNLFVEISEMEAKLDDHRALGKDNPYIILPRLLHRYFWALEHYNNTTATHASQENIQNILKKIKYYDSNIYNKINL